MLELQEKRLKQLLRHVNNVQENCFQLGEKLIEAGEEQLGLALVVNGRCHDASKFKGIEWLYLHGDVKDERPELFKMAATQHITTNRHHPEAWPGGIEAMDELHLAELSCDWAARSSEFGNDVWEWIRTDAAEKYKFSKCGRVYKTIKRYLTMLLEPRFT